MGKIADVCSKSLKVFEPYCQLRERIIMKGDVEKKEIATKLSDLIYS
jgi:hypothetical protein